MYTLLFCISERLGEVTVDAPRPGGEAAEAISHVLGADCEAQGNRFVGLERRCLDVRLRAWDPLWAREV